MRELPRALGENLGSVAATKVNIIINQPKVCVSESEMRQRTRRRRNDDQHDFASQFADSK